VGILGATVTLLTDHYTNARLGTNDFETFISPATVTSANFGKLCTYSVDGDVYAQPLYVPNVSGVTGQSGAVNLLVVATMHSSLYAFNADKCGAPIWNTNFGTNQAPNSYVNTMGDGIYNRETGCKGTPIIEPSGQMIYSVCSTATTWVLRKTNLLDGTQVANVIITGTVSGITFCPLCQQNTAGATLSNVAFPASPGRIYVSFGSMFDDASRGSWYGWVFAYDASLSQTAVFCTTCAGGQAKGGVWQAGGGLSVDLSGNLYAITGNGGGTPAAGNLCLSVIKLSPALALLDWYSTSDYSTYNTNDWDLSSGRPMLIPGTSLVVFGDKNYALTSLNTACMGNIGGTNNGCTAPQTFATGAASGPSDHRGIYGGVYIPGLHEGFFPNTTGSVYAFSLTGSTWNTTPVISSGTYQFPGSQMMASCNNGSACIVWGTMPVSGDALLTPRAAKLVAFNPTTLDEYWSSTGRAGDAVGTLAKLTIPTVANGKIYVGTLDQTVVVYGPNLVNHILIGQIKGL